MSDYWKKLSNPDEPQIPYYIYIELKLPLGKRNIENLDHTLFSEAV